MWPISSRLPQAPRRIIGAHQTLLSVQKAVMLHSLLDGAGERASREFGM